MGENNLRNIPDLQTTPNKAQAAQFAAFMSARMIDWAGWLNMIHVVKACSLQPS